MNQRPNNSVTIIGAGIIGVCSAWHLQKRGFDVTLIDNHSVANNTSFGNAGCISPSTVAPFSHPNVLKEVPKWLLQPNSPLVIRWRQLTTMLPWLKQFVASGKSDVLPQSTDAIANLMQHITDDWQHIINEAHAQSFVDKKGVIKLYRDQNELQHEQWALDLSKEYGYDYTELRGMKLQSLEPDLHVTDDMIGLLFPSWQHVFDPQGVTQHIMQSVLSNGGKYIQDKVKNVNTPMDGSVNIQTISGKVLKSDHCVIACGPWSNTLAKQLDHAVPLLPKRGYHSMLHDTNIRINHPLLANERLYLITPMHNGIRIAGTAEFDQLDATPNYKRADFLVKHFKKYFPQLKTESVTQWMGQRPMLPDSRPIISKSPSKKNIYYAFGHGHYGLTQGPTTGRLIAEIISGEESMDLKAYEFGRFK